MSRVLIANGYVVTVDGARSVHPGSYDVMNTIDGQGLRGVRDAKREKTPGLTRVAVFGCSQTFGSGVAAWWQRLWVP